MDDPWAWKGSFYDTDYSFVAHVSTEGDRIIGVRVSSATRHIGHLHQAQPTESERQRSCGKPIGPSLSVRATHAAQRFSDVVKNMASEGQSSALFHIYWKHRCDQNGRPARREENAYLKGYVTDEQRGRPPIFIATHWAAAGCLFFGVARSSRINLDMLVVRALKQPTELRRCFDICESVH